MSRLRIVAMSLVLLLAMSCGNRAGESYEARLRGNVVLVQMEEYHPAFRNTMKGWREFFAPGIDPKRDIYPYPYGTMNKEYMQWNMMENVKSDGVDKVISYSNHRWEGVEDMNMKIIPRAFLVWIEPWHGGKPKNPDNPDDLNGWHWPSDMQPEDAPYKNVPGEWTCYLEKKDSLTPIRGGYFAPEFNERVTAFVKKLGQAWDNDPRVAFVEMGIIGEWGEHHDPDITTFWPPHDEPEHVYGRTWIDGIDKVLGDAFTEAFKNKKVMVRYAYDFKDYDFGIYWDSWAIDEEIERGYRQMLSLGDRWKTQPIGGEITWNWGSLYLQGNRCLEDCLKNEKTFDLILEQIRNLHCNHLGGVTWADWSDSLFLERAGELQKAMGHRFVLSEAGYTASAKVGKPIHLEFAVTNTGSSPFYYSWPLEVSLLDPETHDKVYAHVIEEVDITQWLPGEEWDVHAGAYRKPAPANKISCDFIPDNLKPGRYVIALSILDPAGMLPSVRFANTNYFTGGRTPLGYVWVGEKAGDPNVDIAQFADLQNDTTLKYTLE